MIGGDGVRDVLHQHRLAGARRRHDQRALALADGRDDIDHASGKILSRGIVDLHAETLIGEQRREVVEIDLVLGLFRILEIERVDFEQREITFAFFRAADVAFDGVAGAKAEAADLRGRDVDVVGAGQVVGVGRTEEAKAVGENFDDAFADNVGLGGREVFEDGEHQLLLAHGAGIFDRILFRERDELGRRFRFEVLKFDFPHWGGPVEHSWFGRDARWLGGDSGREKEGPQV